MSVVITPCKDIDVLVYWGIRSKYNRYDAPTLRDNLREKVVAGFKCFVDDECVGCSFISKIELPCGTIYTVDGFRDDELCNSLSVSVKCGLLTISYARAILGIEHVFIFSEKDNVHVWMLARAMKYKTIMDKWGYFILADKDFYKEVIHGRRNVRS